MISPLRLTPASLASLTLLFLTALIHFRDVPGKLSETPPLGWMYILLVAGCSAAGAWLLSDRWRLGYLLGALICGGAALAYSLTRTIGLAGSSKDDIGNWFEPAGVVSLIVELSFVGLAVLELRRPQRRSGDALN